MKICSHFHACAKGFYFVLIFQTKMFFFMESAVQVLEIVTIEVEGASPPEFSQHQIQSGLSKN